MRLVEQAIADVWLDRFGYPVDGIARFEGDEQPDTFDGDYYTVSRIDTLKQEHMGVGTISGDDDPSAAWYEYRGNLFTKVCGAKHAPGSYFAIKDIADDIRRKFLDLRDPTYGIEFTNARLNDQVTQSGQWYQVYATVEWSFAEALTVAV